MLGYFAVAASITAMPKIVESSAQIIRAVRSLRSHPPAYVQEENDVEALIKISELLCMQDKNDSKIASVAKGLLAEAVAELQTVVNHRDAEREMYNSSWFGRFDNETHDASIRSCCERVERRIRIVEKYTCQSSQEST